MATPEQIESCRRLVASVAAGQLDHLSTSDRIMVCEGIASLYPGGSREAEAAAAHAQALRAIELQQLELNDLLHS